MAMTDMEVPTTISGCARKYKEIPVTALALSNPYGNGFYLAGVSVSSYIPSNAKNVLITYSASDIGCIPLYNTTQKTIFLLAFGQVTTSGTICVSYEEE